MKKYSRSPLGGRGLKCLLPDGGRRKVQSLPSRGAWIEILWPCLCASLPLVAPLSGGVD